MNRRNFLRVAGSTGIILAACGAGIGTFVATRTPQAALRPWESAGSQYSDPLRKALSYAILAPNPHNRQPWMVGIKGDTEAVLTCDLERLLPDTDPFNRQIVIGLGCFLELFSLAAQNDGYRAEITLFPQGQADEQLDARPVAHLKLVRDPNVQSDALFAQALKRHTNRSPYDLSKPITTELLSSISSVASSEVFADGVVEGTQLDQLRKLTQAALRDEILDPQAFQESIDLMRIGRTEIEANPDGISLGGAFLETLNLVGALDRQQLADPASSAFQIGLEMADEQALTATGFVWVNTRNNTRFDQIAAGRSYMRIALEVTRAGLSMQPMSQALQEYPAMQPHYKQIHGLLAKENGERVQMLARLGYAAEVGPSPRWDLTTRITTS